MADTEVVGHVEYATFVATVEYLFGVLPDVFEYTSQVTDRVPATLSSLGPAAKLQDGVIDQAMTYF